MKTKTRSLTQSKTTDVPIVHLPELLSEEDGPWDRCLPPEQTGFQYDVLLGEATWQLVDEIGRVHSRESQGLAMDTLIEGVRELGEWFHRQDQTIVVWQLGPVGPTRFRVRQDLDGSSPFIRIDVA